MGRPRLPDRDDAIRDATFELLVELGYDKLRIQDVADRAGVGLATIYRRWPTKNALIVAALDRKHDAFEDLVLPDDPAEALAATISFLAGEMAGEGADFFPSVIAALRAEPELREVFHGRVVDSVCDRFRPLIVAALGTEPADIALRTDAVLAMLLFRVMIMQNVDDPDAFAAELTAFLLTPPR